MKYGRLKLDKYGYFIVEHDLHNHSGELSDGIAEAFIKFVKNEGLYFWVTMKKVVVIINLGGYIRVYSTPVVYPPNPSGSRSGGF